MKNKMNSKIDYTFIWFIAFYLLVSCAATPNKKNLNRDQVAMQSTMVPKSDTLYPFSQKIFSSYAKYGRVNYKAIQNDPDFPKALEELASVNPENLKSKNEKLAFWINVYNLFTINAIIKKYPVKSINELHFAGSLSLGFILNQTIWDTYWFEISKQKYNLTYVEHKIIRKEFSDFRIHAAIVCAAKSCPPLRSEIYHPKYLDSQLDSQMKIFLMQEDKNYYDKRNNILYLSKIFNWFEKDFITEKGSLLQNLEPYFPRYWKDHFSKEKPNIDYTEYDWSLNE